MAMHFLEGCLPCLIAYMGWVGIDSLLNICYISAACTSKWHPVHHHSMLYIYLFWMDSKQICFHVASKAFIPLNLNIKG